MADPKRPVGRNELNDGKLADAPSGRGPEERITAGIQEAYGVFPVDQKEEDEGEGMDMLHP
ncbi:hypothetical protein [Staphylospora marina]|uniref:hypothetical protein n=1 Tax=Staphylospora marina TaxID=2490858 RepID=UPI000F5C14C6|nr:hypothetical protein [Staphylospora marina]